VREIKFRQPLFKTNGEFFKFHYWGDVDGGFVSPVAGNLGRNSQEYTGLKDKNGKEIYEGDVVAINGGANPIKTEVFFEDGCYCVKMLDNTCELKYYTEMQFCETEIIGNIYENPPSAIDTRQGLR